MNVIARLTAILLGVLLLASCGEGYAVKPARLHLIHAREDSRRELTAVISPFLAKEGFEDLGRYDEMIDLLSNSSAPGGPNKAVIDRVSRQYTYVNKARKLDVNLLDYSDGRSPNLKGDDPRRTPNVIEITVTEWRPGGMSPEGHQFYAQLLQTLRAHFGADIVVVDPPPPNDAKEYRRITLANQIGGIVMWCVAFLVPSLVIGPVTLYYLSRTRLSALPRRIILTSVNTLLSTPVLMQAASIMVLPGPNIFAFPWTDLDFYARGGPYNYVSFGSAFLLSAAASILLVKAKTERA